MFRDMTAELRSAMPELRGKLDANAPTAPLSWFRTGGPAQVLYSPADADDLAYFLTRVDRDTPVLVVGLGSNLLIRDGGWPGIMIRLGKAFSNISILPDHRVRAGAGAPDVKVARAAADAGISGLSFLRGIPGTIGGALRMNGGAYGGETKDVLVEAAGVSRGGERLSFSNREMKFTYRHTDVPDDVIFTEAVFQGRPGEPEAILAEMNAITEARSSTQPVNTRTGGSTFKNPAGQKAWQLIDEAGCRGLRIGDAQVSEMHSNILINHGAASAAEIENLGEEVRRRVRETTGVSLDWEIKRVGQALA
jgi:UDP-N-acetylmuramate dehydrogenase